MYCTTCTESVPHRLVTVEPHNSSTVQKLKTKPPCPVQDGSLFTGTFDFDSEPFDWGGDGSRTSHNPKDLVVYEMPVR